jgi:glyoxylase-like metal-dependent hydrolase (beta-lactamase superfamily II)
MARRTHRNADSAPGDWYIDSDCIDCAASRTVAPGLIVRRGAKSVFARQPAGHEEEMAAWRALLLCPTASVGTETHRTQPPELFPQELAPGLYRCGYNARASFGAHSYFVVRAEGNLLIDSPRFTHKLVARFDKAGGVSDILLTHRDDVADAERYMRHFHARTWIHEHDRSAAPFATNILRGAAAAEIRDQLLAIPTPGHTHGSVVFLLEERYLFTGDSLAWNLEGADLQAFRDACWYSWREQANSLERLTAYRFEWILAGHGGSTQLPHAEMRRRLEALVWRMRRR